MKILIVDDNKLMRMVIIKMLQACDIGEYEYREACDGLQALDVIKEFNPDIVLSDHHMPNIDGLGLLELLRAAGNDVDFAFITTEKSESLASQGFKKGVKFFISKPFVVEEFEAALKSVNKKIANWVI